MSENKVVRVTLPGTADTLSSLRLYTGVSHEAEKEYTLPDYMPAIRRVVSVEATALPESRFVSGPVLEFGGTVSYSVLYIGEDGTLFCAPLSDTYSGSCALGEGEGIDAAGMGVDTAVDSVSCRVSGPRRLTLRAKMKTKLCALSAREIGERITDEAGATLAPSEYPLERRTVDVQDVCVSRGELTASAEGNLHPSGGGKVIHCTGAVRVEEARAENGAVCLRGDVTLHLLWLSGEGRIVPLSDRAGFSQTVYVSDAREGDCARGWGRAAAISVEEEEGGVRWEIEYDLEAESIRPCVRSCTADAYSTEHECRLQETEYDTVSLLRCGVGGLSISGESTLSAAPGEGTYILNAQAQAVPESVERQGRKLTLHGNAAVSVRLAGEGDVVCEEMRIPFRYECTSDNVPEGEDGELLWRCDVQVCDVRARMDGDRLMAEAELCISMAVLNRGKIRAVETVVLDTSAPIRPAQDVIRIVYPDAGERIWNVAKKYRVRARDIVEGNHLTDESRCDGTPLLV